MVSQGCVRRAGELAIALGIGAAVAAGGSGVASAEPADASASPTDSATGSAAPRSDFPRRGTRPGSAPRRPTTSSAAAKPAGQARNDHSTSVAEAAAATTASTLRPPSIAEQLTERPAEPTRRAAEHQTAGLGNTPASPTPAGVPPAASPLPTSAPEIAVRQAVPAPSAASSPQAAPAPALTAAATALVSLSDPPPTGPVDAAVSWLMMSNTPRVPGRTRAAAQPAASVSTAQVFGAAAAEQPAADPITAFITGVVALFANRPPTLHPSQTGQAANGVVTGTLGSVDADSVPLTYAVTGNPAHGTVSIGADGSYTYTADSSGAVLGITDSFRVAVSDASSGFHFHGLAGLINALTFGLIGDGGHMSTATVAVTVAPFNNLPTGYAVVGDPDPTTGAVAGTVIGSDLDGDALTYSGSGATAKGALIVSASGDFSYEPTAEALQSAAAPFANATDKRDIFFVTIDDGRGGSMAVPVTVRIVLTEDLSTFCGCTLMPANTVFHADVRNLPVLAKSDTWTTLLGSERGGTLIARWGGEPWMGSTGGMPVNIVSATHPTETVIFNRGYSTSGPHIDDRPYAIPDRPLVEGMPDFPAWDRHLLVFQEGTCISQELYNVANGIELPAAGIGDALANAAYAAIWDSAWIAEAGVHVDMNSPLYPAQGWANASRLPYLPLILRPDDLERGSIDHMLGIVIAKDRGTGYTWPARAGDGTGTNPDGIPMGTVFRLRADFDITGFDPATQVVLRALQDHGAVVYDSFGPGQDGAGLMAMSNGWTGTDHLSAKRELSTIPIGAFEAVDVLSLAVDPATGWVITSTTV